MPTSDQTPEDPFNKRRGEVTEIISNLHNVKLFTSYIVCTQLTAAMQPLRPYEKMDTLQQFLEHDRQVLRFDCHWDDTGRLGERKRERGGVGGGRERIVHFLSSYVLSSMFGDKRELVLHYFLADDTIEILEKIPPNAGRDAISMFLRRARLPKDLVPLYQPGVQTKRTVLNVFGPTGHGGRYILDSLKV